MKYIEENLKGLNLDLAKTGVKYLHSKARNYDIAVYFEANGHGTIYCNEKLIDKFTLLSSLIENSKDSQILELIQPENLQMIIDQLVSKFNQARAFIRPSGTEDVVRIYTEAENIDDAKLITQKLVEELKQY